MGQEAVRLLSPVGGILRSCYNVSSAEPLGMHLLCAVSLLGMHSTAFSSSLLVEGGGRAGQYSTEEGSGKPRAVCMGKASAPRPLCATWPRAGSRGGSPWASPGLAQ
jgi:hypothetical protein